MNAPAASVKPALWVALAAGPLAWLLSTVLARAPGLVEQVWGQRVTRWFAMAVGTFTGLVPFSVAEVGSAAIVVGLGVWAVTRPRGTGPLLGRVTRALVWAGIRALATISAGYAVFLLVWGLAARREPVGDTLGYPTAESDVDALARLYQELVAQSNALRAQMPEVDGVARPLGDSADVLARAVTLYGRAGERWPLLAGRYAPPKAVIGSRLLSAVGIQGIYVPFTGEAHVSTAGPPFALAFSACHEMAHQRGFTRENEANFVAYLVARDAGDLDFRYAASFFAQVYTAGALGEVDYDRWQALRANIAPGVLADAEAYWNWIHGTRTRVADVTAVVNDTYLRSQGSSGVQSYGEVVDLLLAERRARVGAE